ncbi:hypothetical protein CLIB1444_03S10880 [[Candida] jaroonii]|uniref:Uncharacterized protein n=1 Tax=[Candida] jaroonii TaxID=467808 RepID=A0ACA9Y6K4_9ASCO|nr:hypothetical protein CLIB1444_03S10880 [[Candida] jaroonii]
MCSILKGEKVISDKTLTDLNDLLQILVLEDTLKSKILKFFDDLDRRRCKSWLLLIFIRFPLTEIYNLWQFLFTNEVLTPVCLEVLLKDSLLETKTSWFSSIILVNRTIKKRDCSRLKQFYETINGQNRLLEKLKRNSDLTTCLNLLKFVKINDFMFQSFNLDERILFLNGHNPVFKNLYQMNKIECKVVSGLNCQFPNLIFVHVVDGAMIIWINYKDYVIDLANLCNVTKTGEGRLKLAFKRISGSDRVTLIGTAVKLLEIDLKLKNPNQYFSLHKKLSFKQMKPRRVSVSLIPFDLSKVDTDWLSGSKPLAAKNTQSSKLSAKRKISDVLEMDSSVNKASSPLKSQNPNPQVHAKVLKKVEFESEKPDVDSDELTVFSFDDIPKLDSLMRDVKEKHEPEEFFGVQEPMNSPKSSQIKVVKKRNSIIGNSSDESSDELSSDSESNSDQIHNKPIQVAESQQFPREISAQMEIPETQDDHISPSVSPIGHGTTISSIRSNKVLNSSKYDIIQENLSNLNTSLLEKMKSFENEILNKQNELNNELEEKFKEILANHNENLDKLNDFIDLKKSQIFNVND